MADYATLNVPPNRTPVLAAAATENVTWQARRGRLVVSTKSTTPNITTDGILVQEGFGVEIAMGKAVWYWALGSDTAVVTREAL